MKAVINLDILRIGKINSLVEDWLLYSQGSAKNSCPFKDDFHADVCPCLMLITNLAENREFSEECPCIIFGEEQIRKDISNALETIKKEDNREPRNKVQNTKKLISEIQINIRNFIIEQNELLEKLNGLNISQVDVKIAQSFEMRQYPLYIIQGVKIHVS